MIADPCPECGASLADHAPHQHERERLADSIAHDVVTAPPDDASEAVIASRFRCVSTAYAAAYRALADGGDEQDAVHAAEHSLDAMDVEDLP